MLCLRFAKKCLENEKVKNFVPRLKPIHQMKKRKQKKFKVNKTNTVRYKKSAIPYMQNLLNNESDKKRIMMET